MPLFQVDFCAFSTINIHRFWLQKELIWLYQGFAGNRIDPNMAEATRQEARENEDSEETSNQDCGISKDFQGM